VALGLEVVGKDDTGTADGVLVGSVVVGAVVGTCVAPAVGNGKVG